MFLLDVGRVCSSTVEWVRFWKFTASGWQCNLSELFGRVIREDVWAQTCQKWKRLTIESMVWVGAGNNYSGLRWNQNLANTATLYGSSVEATHYVKSLPSQYCSRLLEQRKRMTFDMMYCLHMINGKRLWRTLATSVFCKFVWDSVFMPHEVQRNGLHATFCSSRYNIDRVELKWWGWGNNRGQTGKELDVA